MSIVCHFMSLWLTQTLEHYHHISAVLSTQPGTCSGNSVFALEPERIEQTCQTWMWHQAEERAAILPHPHACLSPVGLQVCTLRCKLLCKLNLTVLALVNKYRYLVFFPLQPPFCSSLYFLFSEFSWMNEAAEDRVKFTSLASTCQSVCPEKGLRYFHFMLLHTQTQILYFLLRHVCLTVKVHSLYTHWK